MVGQSPIAWPCWATAAGLGLVHALVDAATVGTVYTEVGLGRMPFDAVVRLVIAYNVLAFGLQPLLGWVVDRFRAYRPAAIAGLAATLAGLVVGTRQPYAAMALVGVGNALYHVGAGAIVLRQWAGRATGPGIFVAPGALGLAVGVQQGLAGFPYRWAIASALIAAAAGVAFARTARVGSAAPSRSASVRPTALLAAAVILLLLSAGIRALAGTGLVEPWRSVPNVAWLLTAAAVAGKALGGIAADRLGWRLVPVAALGIMAACACWAAGEASLTVASVLLLQTSMAVTLAAVAVALPSRPALAFGLPSLALLIGDLPSALGALSPNVLEAAVPLLGVGAALMIYVGLGCLGVGTPRKWPGKGPRSQV